CVFVCFFFFFQAEDGIRYWSVTGVQTCALPIWKVDYDDFQDAVVELAGSRTRITKGNVALRLKIDPAAAGAMLDRMAREGRLEQIGRASCRERGESAGGGGSVEKKA